MRARARQRRGGRDIRAHGRCARRPDKHPRRRTRASAEGRTHSRRGAVARRLCDGDRHARGRARGRRTRRRARARVRRNRPRCRPDRARRARRRGLGFARRWRWSMRATRRAPARAVATLQAAYRIGDAPPAAAPRVIARIGGRSLSLVVAVTGWDPSPWIAQLAALLPGRPILTPETHRGPGRDPLRADLATQARRPRRPAQSRRDLLARRRRRSCARRSAPARGRRSCASSTPISPAHERMGGVAGHAAPPPVPPLRSPAAREDLGRGRGAAGRARGARRHAGARRARARRGAETASDRLRRRRLEPTPKPDAGSRELSRRGRPRRLAGAHRHSRLPAAADAGNARAARTPRCSRSWRATEDSAGRSSSMRGGAACRSRPTSSPRSNPAC